MGKSRKFEGVGGGGERYDPVEWKFPGGGGSKTKVFSLGGMDIFWNYTISTVSEGVKTWGKACLLTLYFEWWAKRSVRERARPSLSFRVLLAFAFHDICLREFAHRLWWDAPVSMFCKQEHFSISYLEVNVLQRHVKLPDNLDTSTFKRPQTCKKGNSLSLKSEPTFQRKKNVAYILEAVFVVVVVWNVR